MNQLTPQIQRRQPVLLTATYNDDQVKFLIQKAMDRGIALCIPVHICVYVRIDDPDKHNVTKILDIPLTVGQIRKVWQSQNEMIKLKIRLHDDDDGEEIDINLRGVMVDKFAADFYLKAASEEIDLSNPMHVNNIPSLSKLTQFNPSNPYNIKLTWKEIGTLKIDISCETPETRRERIKNRVSDYMQIHAGHKPVKSEIIKIIYTQESAIRIALGIPMESHPSLETYNRDEREKRKSR